LPTGGVNLFQGIKAKRREAEAAGQKLHRLSIGQPAGPALLSARKAASHHFEPYIRYSVTGDIEAMAGVIEDAFSKAKVSYK
jgi:hypothetical protein